MADQPDPAAALRRWVVSGGHWEVLAERDGAVTVGLFTCDGGEEMDRLVVRPRDLPDRPPAG
ncbi:MAG TPA: hypothetical protein VNS81_06475 [Nocardioides sp.]|nr:hypothetical protein [Nocardioides sp.]